MEKFNKVINWFAMITAIILILNGIHEGNDNRYYYWFYAFITFHSFCKLIEIQTEKENIKDNGR